MSDAQILPPQKTVLFIAHAPSPNTRRLADAASSAIKSQSEVALQVMAPFETTAEDAIAADGILIATTENIGYMAGLTKDFFDRSYNPMLEVTAGKPVAVYIRAGLDGTGSRKALEGILTGLRWRLMAEILICRGAWQDGFVNEVEQLALTLALRVEMET